MTQQAVTRPAPIENEGLERTGTPTVIHSQPEMLFIIESTYRIHLTIGFSPSVTLSVEDYKNMFDHDS